MRDEVEDEVGCPRVAQIEAQRSLPSVLLHVITRTRSTQARQGTTRVTLLSEFDLDHLGTQLDQKLGRRGASQHLRKVEYPNSVEYPLHS